MYKVKKLSLVATLVLDIELKSRSLDQRYRHKDTLQELLILALAGYEHDNLNVELLLILSPRK